MASKVKTGAPRTPRENRFAAEWLKDYDHHRAAKAAGYAQPLKLGSTILKRLRPYLNEQRRQKDAVVAVEMAKKFVVDEKAVLQELIALGFANALDYVEFDRSGPTVKARRKGLHELTRAQAAAVSDIRFNLKAGTVEYSIPGAREKRPALEMIGKNFGMFDQKLIAEHRHVIKQRAADLKKVDAKTLEELEALLIKSIGAQEAKQFLGHTREATEEEEDDAA